MRKQDHDYFIAMIPTRARWMRDWEESLGGLDMSIDADSDDYTDPDDLLYFPNMHIAPPEDHVYQI